MILVSDFIVDVKDDLQEKSEQWSKESLFLKLQRAYISLQYDLPYFMTKESLVLEEDKDEFSIEYDFIQAISLSVDGTKWDFVKSNNIYDVENETKNKYTFHQDKIILSKEVLANSEIKIAYKYKKTLENQEDNIETPIEWNEALRWCFLSKIHEKPTKNTKERNLAIHYINLYDKEILKLKNKSKDIERNVTSTFQVI